jgi:hypothetical protein
MARCYAASKPSCKTAPTPEGVVAEDRKTPAAEASGDAAARRSAKRYLAQPPRLFAPGFKNVPVPLA